MMSQIKMFVVTAQWPQMYDGYDLLDGAINTFIAYCNNKEEAKSLVERSILAGYSKYNALTADDCDISIRCTEVENAPVTENSKIIFVNSR